MKSAIYTSLYSSGMVSLPQPPYSCPRGNCTWPPFPTIAVSAQCFDHTSRIHLNCSSPNMKPWNGNNFTACAMEFRNSSLLDPWEPSPRLCFESKTLREFGSDLDQIGDFNYGYSYMPHLQAKSSSLSLGYTTFSWNLAKNLTMDYKNNMYSRVTSSSTIKAGYCIFYISMQVIKAEVQNGVYNERVIKETTEIYPHSGLPWAKKLSTFSFQPECQTKAPCVQVDGEPKNLSLPGVAQLRIVDPSEVRFQPEV
jgi:hypothetical protein